MNNFQTISSAVILLAACFGLTACEQNAPSKGNCISYPEDTDPHRCKTPIEDERYCLGGEDFICLKDERNDISTYDGEEGW